MKLLYPWIKVAIGGLILASLAWAGANWLHPLGQMLPMIRSMVTITQGILVETRDLQTEINAVQATIKHLQLQDMLLEEQEQLAQALLTKLQLQGEISTEATALLIEILREEQKTLEISQAADVAGAATIRAALATARELERIQKAAARINQASHGVDQELDLLLIELDGSAENLAIIARIKAAPLQVWDRYLKGWEWVRGWFK